MSSAQKQSTNQPIDLAVVRQFQPNACVVDTTTITELSGASDNSDRIYPRVSRLRRGEPKPKLQPSDTT